MSRTRLSAAERTEQIVCAAVSAFSTSGYAGTSTDDVARVAGVSQPYVIRLFRSKQRLFLAGVEYAAREIERTFRESGATDLDGLGEAYRTLLGRYEVLGMLMHGFAAAGGDPEIGESVRGCLGRIYELVRELTGADPREAADFVSTGIFLTVLSSVRVIGPDAVSAQPWMTDIQQAFKRVFEGEGA
ncbi:TetR/AcrR family transcriptional regulator [Actinophytocola sp.]|uniref:TetR/AcrR family transcriptional regulator n=1 Tax=Actinophytocola sp. TaxID=1872138 RepID=UPI00389B2B9A